MTTTESKLIREARRGSLQAFNDLVLSYQDLVYSVSYRIMGEPASAADVCQETFLTAYQKLETYRGGSFKSWLLRIATNTCYDLLRYHQRRPTTSLEELTGADYADDVPLPSPAETPEQAVQRAELNGAIQACISALNADQRMALVLCDVQAYSYQEIAELAEASLGTVKSRISRARQAVRACLQSSWELLPAAYRQVSDD